MSHLSPELAILSPLVACSLAANPHLRTLKIAAQEAWSYLNYIGLILPALAASEEFAALTAFIRQIDISNRLGELVDVIHIHLHRIYTAAFPSRR